MRAKCVLLFLTLGLSACAYTHPVTKFDRSAHPLSVVGVVSDSFADTATADQPRTVSYGMINGTVDLSNSAIAAERAQTSGERFTATLAAVNYDPEASFRRSLSEHLGQVGVRTVNLDNVVRRRHPGISRIRIEYVGAAAEPVDAYLDVQFIGWGFASKPNETVLRPYLYFVASLNSPDGAQNYMREVIQFNQNSFGDAVETTVVSGSGDASGQFASLDELNANPEQAVRYLDAAIDQVAREIAMRLQ